MVVLVIVLFGVLLSYTCLKQESRLEESIGKHIVRTNEVQGYNPPLPRVNDLIAPPKMVPPKKKKTPPTARCPHCKKRMK
jgi:hypothetical protein